MLVEDRCLISDSLKFVRARARRQFEQGTFFGQIGLAQPVNPNNRAIADLAPVHRFLDS